MAKKITDNQLIGELGEAAVRKRFLSMGFQFDGRGRLEAGIDGIAEIMIEGEPTARMIAVQIKSTRSGKYAHETDAGFTYLLHSSDLEYWKPSNLPVIIVLYRETDETFYWKSIDVGVGAEQRQLNFEKTSDQLNRDAVDRLAALTVPKDGHGFYVPPLRDGEEALVNLLPISLPKEIYVASTPYDSKRAIAELFKSEDDKPRFDWAIKGGSYWSFHDPREASTSAIVDLDQVDAIETDHIAFHEDIDERHNFSFLMRQVLQHQVQQDLAWDKQGKSFYFRALNANQSRKFRYISTVNQASSDVVNAVADKKDNTRISFVRHHAFIPRFELLMDQWFLMVNPTYYFTTNGFLRHSHPHALLSGKKRLDNNASLRGQVIMWHRYLSKGENDDSGLFAEQNDSIERVLEFGTPPSITLPTTVPEDVWGPLKKTEAQNEDQRELELYGV